MMSRKRETQWEPPTGGETPCLGTRVLPTPEQPTSYNKKVAACARFARSGERGTEAAPATSGRYAKQSSAAGYVSPSESYQVRTEEKEHPAPPPAV